MRSLSNLAVEPPFVNGEHTEEEKGKEGQL